MMRLNATNVWWLGFVLVPKWGLKFPRQIQILPCLEGPVALRLEEQKRLLLRLEGRPTSDVEFLSFWFEKQNAVTVMWTCILIWLTLNGNRHVFCLLIFRTLTASQKLCSRWVWMERRSQSCWGSILDSGRSYSRPIIQLYQYSPLCFADCVEALIEFIFVFSAEYPYDLGLTYGFL